MSSEKLDARKYRVKTGKSARPDEFSQTTVYLSRETKLGVMETLVRHPSRMNLSDLMEHLLKDWLAAQTKTSES